MKKFLLFSMLAVAGTGKISAQSFDEDYIVWTAGYGVGAWLDVVENSLNNSGGYNSLRTTSTGPLYAKLEYGITDEYGIGINIAYVGREWNYNEEVDDGSGNKTNYLTTVSYTSFSFLLRVNRHFSDNDKLDAYWGGGVGYRGGTYKQSSLNPNYNQNEEFKDIVPLGADLTVGMRFYFTPQIAIYLETGMAKSVLQFGLSGRF